MKTIIKRLIIIIMLMFLISVIFSKYSHATIGNIFSSADVFLKERKSGKRSDK